MNRFLSRLGGILLALATVLSCLTPCFGAGEDNVLYIRSVEDFLTFAENCRLDTYSQGLTVALAADIDLTGTDFTPIPIFCGVFDGGGHTVSGLSVSGPGSHTGLFRYLQTGGRIENLHVSGDVRPGGSQSMSGGVVGTNRGVISNCSFAGSVDGGSAIGGIAGINEQTGIITGCVNTAGVTGYHYVGGVTGRNMGTVADCRNEGSVNTVYLEPSGGLSLTDLSVDTDDLGVITDVGGIAGLSSGIITGCVNTGEVGYPYTGYNIGGVAGRQSGYMGLCENHGAVRGRKDVGGVVGQAEPHISADVDGGLLPALTQELDRLQALVDDTLSDAKSTSTAISAGFSAVSGYTSAAAQDAAYLAGRVASGLESAVTGASELAEKLRYILDSAGLLADDLRDGAERLARSADELAEAAGGAPDPAPETSEPVEAPEPEPAAEPETEPAAEQPAEEPETEPAAEQPEPEAAGEQPPEDSGEIPAPDGGGEQPLPSETAAVAADGEAVPVVAAEEAPSQPDAAQAETGGTEGAGIPASALLSLDSLQDSAGELSGYAQALSGDIAALENCLSQSDYDGDELAALAATLTAHLESLSLSASPALSDITALTAALAPYGEETDPALQALLDSLRSAGEHLSGLLADAKNILDNLGLLPDLSLPEWNTETSDRLDSMFQNLSGLGSCLSGLNASVTGGAGVLLDDLKAVNDQFNTVMDLVVQALSGAEELDVTLFSDQSDQDTQEPSNGKLYGCKNDGPVSGDLDVGGVAGTMGMEYDFDLEGDIFGSGGVNLSATYLTKCVLRVCENRGEITARKDCVGGVVGLMEQGSVIACQGYGGVTSTGGGYVGGVAGQSLGTIRASCALCRLSGDGYVGGIAGQGERLYDNRALTDIECTGERAGAVAGELFQDGACAGNLFVDRGLGGIDGVSYGGMAEPAAYGDFCQEEGLPAEFSSFSLTFLADGETVAVIPFSYGDSIDGGSLPAVPEKPGYTGRWADFDYEDLTFSAVVEAVYTAYGATIAADTVREGGTLPLLLAEGSFYPEAAIAAVPSEEAPALESGQRLLESWQVTVTDYAAGEDSFTLHYLLPEAKGRLTLYIRQNGRWQPVDYTTDGSYALFPMEGESVLFCAAETPSPLPYILAASGGALALLLAVLLIRRAKKRRASAAHLKK